MMTMHERRRGPGWTRGSVALVQLGVALALPLIFVTRAFAAGPTSLTSTSCSFTQVTSFITGITGTASFSGSSLSATGARLVFRSTFAVFGGTGDNGLVLFDVPTGTLTQLTTRDASTLDTPRISDDGNRIAFTSSLDPVGENADRNQEIFLLDLTSGAFTQITRTTGFLPNREPAMNGDGTRIAFLSVANLTAENADGNSELFLFDTTTGQFTQVTRTTSETLNEAPEMDGSGTRIVFRSNGGLTGENPDGNAAVFLFDSTTGAFMQITHNTTGAVFLPKISGNGTRIAFDGTADLTDDNPDGNSQVFVFDTTTGTLAQVTRTTGGAGSVSSLDATGTLITLFSPQDLTGENPDRNMEVFLLNTTTGAFTQITRTTGGLPGNLFGEISDNGTRIAFLSDRDLTGGNSDGSREIFLATCGLANELVSLASLPSTFQTSGDTSGCPAGGAGKFSFTGRLASLSGSPALTDLQVQVLTLPNGNLLQNADGGPGGIGATLTVPRANGYADGVLDSGEAVEIPFVICLQNRTPFQFFVDVKGSR